MRKVKLQDTGGYSTNDVAYQAPDKKYYSSEDAYKKIIKNKIMYKGNKNCITLQTQSKNLR